MGSQVRCGIEIRTVARWMGSLLRLRAWSKAVRTLSPRQALIEAAQKKHSTWEWSLGPWVRIVEGVNPPWKNLADVRRTRKGADPLGDCTVFNIAHNEARLISLISYEMQTVTVLAILSRKEYDKGGWKDACNC